jgi:hypothetical protein
MPAQLWPLGAHPSWLTDGGGMLQCIAPPRHRPHLGAERRIVALNGQPATVER